MDYVLYLGMIANGVVFVLLCWTLWIGLALSTRQGLRITDQMPLTVTLAILANKLSGCLYVGFALVGLVLWLGLIR